MVAVGKAGPGWRKKVGVGAPVDRAAHQDDTLLQGLAAALAGRRPLCSVRLA